MQKPDNELTKQKENNNIYKFANFEWWNKEKTGVSQLKVAGDVGAYINLLQSTGKAEDIENEIKDIGHHTRAKVLKVELRKRATLESKLEIIKVTENIMKLFFESYSNYENQTVKAWESDGYSTETINNRLEDQKQNMQNFFNKYLSRIFSRNSHTIPHFGFVESGARPLILGGLKMQDYNIVANELLENLSKFTRHSITSGFLSGQGLKQENQKRESKNKITRNDEVDEVDEVEKSKTNHI